MARPRLSQREIERRFKALEKKYGRQLSQDFWRAIREITDNVTVIDLVRAIEKNDTPLVMRILNLDDKSIFAPMVDTVGEAFNRGGDVVAESLPPRRMPGGYRVTFRFDIRNQRAEDWLRAESSRLVTRIMEDARDAVRSRLSAGMVQGDNPRRTALDIVGRIDRVTGRRTGGIVGLTGPQERWVRNARGELSSAVPSDLQHYLTRRARDQRFDAHVIRAIRDGTAVPAPIRDKMIARYSDNLLKLRGETIGRSEMIESLNRSQWEAYKQAAEKGTIKGTRKEWDSAGDARVRPDHQTLDGKTVDLDDPFISPSKSSLMFPGDRSLGASGKDTIMCRCRVKYVPDFFADIS